MRAFLSHSSKDKGFVDDVVSGLRPGTFELDSITFDKGELNAQAISSALKRSNLFCLFLSRDSAHAPYVEFEALLGIEFFARGDINRFLVICLDDSAFDLASANARYFNIVRKSLSADGAARLIEGAAYCSGFDIQDQTGKGQTTNWIDGSAFPPGIETVRYRELELSIS